MTPIVKLYDCPSLIDTKAVLRYMGARTEDARVLERAADAAIELKDQLVYRTVYAVYPVTVTYQAVRFPFAQAESASLAKHMQGCGYALCMAATVGDAVDRLMARRKNEPLTALAYQAIGSERIEALCDTFEAEMRESAQGKGYELTARFSPGYGDFSLAFQKELFRILDCPTKIGLSLRDTMMMTPSKSVSAIIGIRRNERSSQ